MAIGDGEGVTKVYKIRNGKGLWSSGGSYPSFSKRGKTWDSLGHLKNHLSNYTASRYGYSGNQVPDDWEIVEVQIKYDECSRIKAKDAVAQMQRKAELAKKYGMPFANLVERIEAKNEQDIYQWVLIVGDNNRWSREKEYLDKFKALIKANKLKQHTDYKLAYENDYGVFAFKDKAHAAMLRLAYDGPLVSVDIKNYIETNLDDNS